MDIFIVDWIIRDVDDRQCEVFGIGKDAEGACVAVRCPFSPHFYVEIPPSKNKTMPGRKAFALHLKEETWSGSWFEDQVTTTLVEKKPFVGYRGGSTHHLVLCKFRTLRTFYSARKRAKEDRLVTFEAFADPLLKFFHATGVDPCGWTRIESAVRVPNLVSKPYVNEYRVQSLANVSTSTVHAQPPLKIASFDFETYSSTGNFPNGANTNDAIICVGTSYAMLGSDTPYRQTVHQLVHCDPIDGVEVHVYDDERAMLNGWLEELEAAHVDCLTGYNIWGFDLKYLDARSVVLVSLLTGDSSIRLSTLGHLVDGGGTRVEKKLASAAYGSNEYIYLESPGIVQLDLLAIFRKELKLDSYTLNNVAKTYLDGFTKLDVSAKQMFQWYKDEDHEGLTRMADYCVRDTLLPILLMHKLNTLTNQIEMSKVVCTPISYLNTRGQQIRCYSLLLKHAGKAGFVIDDLPKDTNRDAYVGATVLEPQRGAFTDDVVSVMDFASLYPSIMRAHRMCPSTIVLNDDYGALDGVEYYRIETTPGHIVSFAQTEDAVVPRLLADLAAWRKAAKKDMAAAKARGDTFGVGMFNAKQLAFKVSMNSLYGFFGAGTGAIPLLDLASAVTSTGRRMIMDTKKACEARGHRVVYGDSVASYTPIHVRIDGVYELTTFELLATRLNWVARDDGKEEATMEGLLETWSDQGWTRVLNVIRHEHTDPLVRVCTHTGIVDVTHDHSLLRPDGEMVRPDDVRIGESLMHAPLPPDIGLTSLIQGLDADGDIASDQKTQLSCAALYSTYVSAGYGVSISSRPDTPDMFRLTASRQKLRRHPHVIKDIWELPSTRYVYDFTTTNHHFSAGIGQMVVHNTDSVFVIQNLGEQHRLDVGAHIEAAKRLADELTETLYTPPNQLEYEKVYSPMLLFSKKRYAALMYEFDATKPSKIDTKGLQIVRRDAPPLVRDVMVAVIDVIMHQRSFEQALELARTSILDILEDRVPFEKFIVSKSLRSGYKNPQSLPHVVVAEKRRKRNVDPPNEGERIPFVIIRSLEQSNDLLAARAEDPSYVQEHDHIQLDILHYVRNCLLKPLEAIFELKYPDAKAKLREGRIAERMLVLMSQETGDKKEAKRLQFLKDTRQREITSFFKKK